MGIAAETFTREKQSSRHCAYAIEQFKKITRYYSLFHFGFLTLSILEVFCFLFFFSFFAKSSLLAISLATLFLTGFSYFVLLFYFQAKKPEQLEQLKTAYLDACRETLSFAPGSSDYHISLAGSAYLLVSQLQNQEYSYYTLPKSFDTLSPLLEKLSVWTYWKEVHKMKESLLFEAIDQYLQLVKAYPLDLETHASLAAAYVALSKLYLHPKKLPGWKEGAWVSPEYASHEMRQKFKASAERAIQEFKILGDLAPSDPWTHAELASLYHELEMPQEEIAAYETLLKHSPRNPEVVLRLGVLYFKQGLCAQGLRLYEELKNTHSDKAQELISYYDAYLRA